MIDNTNNKINQQYDIATTALNVVLVVIETLLTLLLRFDAHLRQVVYPLAMTDTVVCIHSYVPNVTFYATFSVNGILLDSQLQPNQQVDVTINGFTWQIVQSLFTNKAKVIDELQIRGTPEKITQIKDFLQQIGINQLLQLVIQTVKGDKKPNQPKKPTKTTDQLRQQLTELQTQLSTTEVAKAQLQAQVLELKSKNKLLTKVLIVVIILLLVCAVGWAMK